MYKLDFNQPINVHFIGIGGISMSGLAQILLTNQFKVSGSDMSSSDIVTKLRTLGAKVTIGHIKNNITTDLDLVVYTAAISQDNVEYKRALELNIETIDRAELLGQIMKNYKYSIGVAGTHGKTTTTSMLSHILLHSDLDPTISVGGILKCIDGNIKVGHSDYFITEACEYSNSFLKFYPYIGIVLNVEEDHLDFFKDIDDIRHSFKQYLENIPSNGYAVVSSDIPNFQEIVSDLTCQVITYGTKAANSDWYPGNMTFDTNGYGSYDLYYKGELKTTVHLQTTGMHNILNSIAAIAVSHLLAIPLPTSQEALLAFSGVKRRFEYKGSLHGIKVIDDYAHHPTEILATLTAAKRLTYNKLWVVFQPHTFSRTKAFLSDFAKVLSTADHIIVSDIYAAREQDPLDIHSKDLVREIQKYTPNCNYFSSFDEIENFLLQNCVKNDLLITMGAGNIYNVGESLLS
jgi:UDP-N-acetylmuramate--alanine ligase